ncbi:hypothetical protein GCM10018793_13050 [Streptomyces sulfonofaciens]|uniref:Uncharacterized protein n=1 Tax=Streptomyces sulfonofaciens TaxID=68272 RepID=A0A919FWH0_9ACTN|nr:hypothetical protein [Streptomyces sulfonofaciens]GHH73757.1 hypothetical protein GCM10018793_13050 [Streptomyces sulfonofaciens]
MFDTPDDKSPAAELNERIRALMLRPGGRLTEDQRAEYQVLLQEWAAAVRGSVVRAA